MANKQPEAFKVFNDWIVRRGYLWTDKFTKKELWKMFVAECAQCGIVNVFKCSDYNKLRKLLSINYIDEEGRTHDGFFIEEDFKFEE